MKTIIISLLLYIQIQWQLINYLLVLLVGKNVGSSKDKLKTPPINELYAKMQIDSFPKIETIQLLDYKQLLAEYCHKHGKELPPARRHKNTKHKVPNTISCPYCGAHITTSMIIMEVKVNSVVKSARKLSATKLSIPILLHVNVPTVIILWLRLKNLKSLISINARMMIVLITKLILL